MPTILRSKGINFVVSSPSGGGKTSLAKALVKLDNNIKQSISDTTRPLRQGEIEGIDYFFKTRQQFEQLVKNGELLEYTKIYDNYYGTPEKNVKALLKQGIDIIFAIEWQGAKAIKQQLPEQTVTIFIMPPSLEVLGQRLMGRAADRHEQVELRLQKAHREIQYAKDYDYVIINEDFALALNRLQSIIIAERTKRIRLDRLDEFLSHEQKTKI